MTDVPDEIELADSGSGDDDESSAEPASSKGAVKLDESGDEWFSATELERDSQVELEGEVTQAGVLTIGPVPSAMRCLEAWGREALLVGQELALAPIYPGQVHWVHSRPAALGVDWAESVVDSVLSRSNAMVLYVVAESATQVEARAWSRALGRNRGDLRGPDAAHTAVQDPKWKAVSKLRRARIRYFQGDGLVDQRERFVEVAEALRSWRRGFDDEASARPVLLVIEEPALTVPTATRARLSRLAGEQAVALLVVGGAEAEGVGDTVFSLELKDAQPAGHPKVHARWSAPIVGTRGRHAMDWDPRKGRLVISLLS